jgi:hypothetical protein
MNVLYIGIDNPITIAVSGYKSEDLIVTMQNGSITGKEGKYIAHVTNIEQAVIIIETMENGKKVLLGTQVYRVKRVPDPINGKFNMDYDAKPTTNIYSIPLKVHLMNNGKIDTYNMLGNGTFSSKQNQLIYVDGEVSTNATTIAATNVKSMETYDALAGEKTFGTKWKNGVLLLTTK